MGVDETVGPAVDVGLAIAAAEATGARLSDPLGRTVPPLVHAAVTTPIVRSASQDALFSRAKLRLLSAARAPPIASAAILADPCFARRSGVDGMPHLQPRRLERPDVTWLAAIVLPRRPQHDETSWSNGEGIAGPDQ
jgi:hypothetical protein